MKFGESFRIAGHLARRPVVFTWRDGSLGCTDACALQSFRAVAAESEPLHPKPHVTLWADLTDRAFVQFFLVTEFLSSVELVVEDPPLVFHDDVDVDL